MRNQLSPADLRAALQRPLPGIAAQIKLAPEYRVESLRAAPPPDARGAGVLLLLYPANGGWRFPLMKRVEDGLVHGGQISLPGGSQEPGESLRETALREACEEIGAACPEAEVLGQLSTIYIPPSNFLVTPTVGYVNERPDFQCDPREVAELIESKREVAKSVSIKGVSCKSGRCARKAVVLTSGDLRRVPKKGLRESRETLTAVQKSAASVVPTEVGKAQTVPRKGFKGVASKRRDS